MPSVPTDDFDATWYPRIGENAAKELRRYRKVAVFVPLGGVFAVGAGALIGRSAVDELIGGVLAVAAIIDVGVWIRAQRRVGAAMSPWFGVRIRWVPRMTPERFDEWRHLRGLTTPDERLIAERTVD